MAKDDDYLAGLPIDQVAEWYKRLAQKVGERKVRGKTPLSSMFLSFYMENRKRDNVLEFTPPNYLKEYPGVRDALRYHRAVFLTQEKARIGKNQKIWGGVVPRLNDGRWPNAKGKLEMNYRSLVEVAKNFANAVRIQISGTPEERDLFGSLQGFQLRSDVIVNGTKTSKGTIRIEFALWTAFAKDYYDFNYNEHLTLPNPDYQSTAEDAVRPGDRDLRVYHSNARRLEKAGLAAPFHVRSKPWHVTVPDIIAPAEVKAKK